MIFLFWKIYGLHHHLQGLAMMYSQDLDIEGERVSYQAPDHTSALPVGSSLADAISRDGHAVLWQAHVEAFQSAVIMNVSHKKIYVPSFQAYNLFTRTSYQTEACMAKITSNAHSLLSCLASAHSQTITSLHTYSWNTCLSRQLVRMRSWWRTNWSVLLLQILSRKLSTRPKALCNWQLQQAVSRKTLSLRSYFFYRLLLGAAGQPFSIFVVKPLRDSLQTVISWAAIHLRFHLDWKTISWWA